MKGKWKAILKYRVYDTHHGSLVVPRNVSYYRTDDIFEDFDTIEAAVAGIQEKIDSDVIEIDDYLILPVTITVWSGD